MPKDSNRGRSRSEWGVMEMARERPIAAAAAAAGAAAAGLFLWSKRSQISHQLNDLNDQIGEWKNNMNSDGAMSGMDDTAGLTTSNSGRARSGAGSRPASGTRSTTETRGRASAVRNRGMSETGGGNASLGAHSGGAGMTTTASGRGRARDNS